MAQHVADVQSPRDRDRNRQDLQAEQPVDSEQARQAVAAAQEECRLLSADRDDRDDRHVLLERKADVALAATEVDLVRIPARAVDFEVATGPEGPFNTTFWSVSDASLTGRVTTTLT